MSRLAVTLVFALVSVSGYAAGASGSQAVRLEVEGISASAGEDDPRVLFILPWRAPSLPRRPRADLDDSVPRLVQPVNPEALERHRVFRETLNPLILSPEPDSAVKAR